MEEKYRLYKIVPVTLQNLIENAIKHNIVDQDRPLLISIYTEQDSLIVKNNLQKKVFIETSNKQGLAQMQSFYSFLTHKPLEVKETESFFMVIIPLL